MIEALPESKGNILVLRTVGKLTDRTIRPCSFRAWS
jgi:hypothetical protein